MSLLIAVVCAVSLSIAVVGCSSSETERISARAAIRAAQESPRGRDIDASRMFPSREQTTKCRIPRGGPGLTYVVGSCKTTVTAKGSLVVVTFTEFFPFGDRTGHHAWEFAIALSGDVVRVRDFGDPAPQFTA